MKELMLYSYVKVKTGLHNLIHEEKGASEVIAMVILLAIAVILGFMFKSKIVALFGKLWDMVTGGSSGTDVTPDLK